MMDLTADNITENTVKINSQGPDLRLTYVLERLVNHMHDFARETRLSTNEWMAGLEYLTAVGKMCSDVRQVGVLDSGTEDFRGGLSKANVFPRSLSSSPIS